MSVTVGDYIEKLEKTIRGLPNLVVDTVEKQETQDLLADMTIRRLEEGKGSDGKELINKNKLFSGVYSVHTEFLYRSGLTNSLLPKVAGELYNFVWTGDFAKSFSFNVEHQGKETPKLVTINTGTGSGDKAAFFDGYGERLFGFYGDQKQKINEIIYKSICDYLGEKL